MEKAKPGIKTPTVPKPGSGSTVAKQDPFSGPKLPGGSVKVPSDTVPPVKAPIDPVEVPK
jgi:hypothetical protein